MAGSGTTQQIKWFIKLPALVSTNDSGQNTHIPNAPVISIDGNGIYIYLGRGVEREWHKMHFCYFFIVLSFFCGMIFKKRMILIHTKQNM